MGLRQMFGSGSVGRGFLLPAIGFSIVAFVVLGVALVKANTATVEDVLSYRDRQADFVQKLGAALGRDQPSELDELIEYTMQDSEVYFAGFYDSEGTLLTAREDFAEKANLDKYQAYVRELNNAYGELTGYYRVYYKNDRIERLQRDIVLLVLVLLGLMLVLFVVFTIALTQRVAVPLEKMASMARGVAEGDLSLTAPELSGDNQMNQLNRAIAQIAAALQEQVGAIKTTSSNLLHSSSEVKGATSQLASAADEQAAAIAQVTAIAEEVKQNGEMSSKKAAEILDVADKSVAISGEGTQAVESSTEQMRLIRDQAEAIATGVTALKNNVKEVSDIIGTVNEIAEQSNLLAVNASIEAAKAGEFGSGFAVVAQEVKDLAQQSKKATIQVRTTLGTITQSIESVVGTARLGQQRSEDGVLSIEHTGGVIGRLTESIASTADSAKQITIGANEQVVGLEQIANTMGGINTAALEYLSSMRGVDKNVESLRTMAEKLNKLVAHYKTEK